jgi:hypothetical protein
MKLFIRFSSVIALAIIAISFIAIKPKDEIKKFISIQQAIKNKLVEAKFSGKGGYQGECIELNIKSLAPKDTIIRIEPGRRLVAEDSALQDILIVKEIQLFLAAGENKEVNIFGFCCQATDGGPQKGSGFSVGFMADSSFIILAEYLAKSSLPLGVMQSAVWVLSDNHSFNSISNDNENDKPKMKELFLLLAKVKKIKYEYPWYSLKYKQDTAQLFTNRPVKIYGEFEYLLSDPANVDLVIKRDHNQLVKNLFVNRPQSPDKYIHRFSFDVADWPKGKYYMILYVDNQQKVKREFEL